MTRPFLFLILFFGLHSFVKGEENQSVFVTESNQTRAEKIDKKSAFVIPVRDQIGPPILDILRRGMKEAIERQVDLIILDMDTPGGELGVTLEIMQEILDSLNDWGGKVLTYVNKEAISAGAYIAIATQEIAFAPFSQIGAAEAVSGGGGEIDPSMKRKINSYLKAKIRNFAGSYKYRSQIMGAMMDANVSLIIEGKPLLAADGSLIKNPGELLTLTGEEAVKTYGNPPQPLLGIGVYKDIDDLLEQRWGKNQYMLIEMKVNWAEEMGLWLNGIAPLFLAWDWSCYLLNSRLLALGFLAVWALVSFWSFLRPNMLQDWLVRKNCFSSLSDFVWYWWKYSLLRGCFYQLCLAWL